MNQTNSWELSESQAPSPPVERSFRRRLTNRSHIWACQIGNNPWDVSFLIRLDPCETMDDAHRTDILRECLEEIDAARAKVVRLLEETVSL